MKKKWKLKMLEDWEGGRKKGDVFFASPDSAAYFEKEGLAEVLDKPKAKKKSTSKKK